MSLKNFTSAQLTQFDLKNSVGISVLSHLKSKWIFHGTILETGTGNESTYGQF